MKISVALCTYNGERYLPMQLDSILTQTRLPDEVVLADDGSSDGTIQLLTVFAARAPFAVTVLLSDGRLGSTKNFERAIRRCSGDVIALSDQDDVWHPSRLEASLRPIAQKPAIVLVFTNADRIDADGRPLAGSLWQSFGFAGASQQSFAAGDYGLLARERFITGATVMLRSAAVEQMLPIPSAWVHDAWLGCVSPFFGEIVAREERLIQYRVHAQQQVGTDVSLWGQQATRDAEKHWARIHEDRLRLDALEQFLEEHAPANRSGLRAQYRARAAFLQFRDTLPPGRVARLGPILRNWEQYRSQASGPASAIKDLLFARRAGAGFPR